jgi:hypothetical protein
MRVPESRFGFAAVLTAREAALANIAKMNVAVRSP